MTYRHLAYRRVIEADRLLPLPVGPAEVPAAVTVHTGAAPPPGAVVSTFDVAGYATVRLVEEGHAHLDARADLSEDVVDHLVCDLVIPTALTTWVAPVLHASAAALDGRTVAFCGPSGIGKSTLAVACAKAGGALLSDDGLLLERRGHLVFATEPYRGIRLHEAHGERLLGVRPAGAVATPNGKRRLDLTATSVNFVAGPLAVDLIAILEPPSCEGSPPTVVRCGAVEAATQVARAMFNPAGPAGAAVAHLDTAARLTAGLGVVRLRYDRALEALPAVVALVREALRGAA